jgi:hypothetical protein
MNSAVLAWPGRDIALRAAQPGYCESRPGVGLLDVGLLEKSRPGQILLIRPSRVLSRNRPSREKGGAGPAGAWLPTGPAGGRGDGGPAGAEELAQSLCRIRPGSPTGMPAQPGRAERRPTPRKGKVGPRRGLAKAGPAGIAT